jgi:hypothetical protein
MTDMTYQLTVTVDGEVPTTDEVEELLSEALAADGYDVGTVTCVEAELAERLGAQVAAVEGGERGVPLADIIGAGGAE